MSCCGGSCSCGSCGCSGSCCRLYPDLAEKNTSTPGTLLLGVSPEKGRVKGFEKAEESGEAADGCGCGPTCSCRGCSC